MNFTFSAYDLVLSLEMNVELGFGVEHRVDYVFHSSVLLVFVKNWKSHLDDGKDLTNFLSKYFGFSVFFYIEDHCCLNDVVSRYF